MLVRPLTVIAFAVTAVVSLGACGEEGPGTAASGREIRIEGREMAFIPQATTTTRGRHRIVFTNAGAVYHELAVVSPGGSVLAARSIPAGETVAMDVDLQRAGTYEVLCREPGHTKAGMVGSLTVQG